MKKYFLNLFDKDEQYMRGYLVVLLIAALLFVGSLFVAYKTIIEH